MSIEIKALSGNLLRTVNADTLVGANLSGAGLRRANLYGADLRYAALRGADLRGADLRYADLRYAALYGATLYGAALGGAALGGAKLNWKSHDLIAEMLRCDAGDDVEKRKVAGLILVSRDWCWERFLGLDEPLRDWALGVLARYVVDGDDAPAVVRAAARTGAEAEASQ